MKQKIKEILSQVFVFLTIFLFAVLIYRISNPYSYLGLENRILFVLIPLAIVLLYLYLEESENRSRLLSFIRITISRLHESKLMRSIESLWERTPSFIRMDVSKAIAVIRTYMLKQGPKQVVSHAFLGMLLILALESVIPQLSLGWARTPVMIAAILLGTVTFYLNSDKLYEIENEASQEKLEENKRKIEFAEKYPRIDRVWGVRWIGKWMYKEGWWYSVGLSLLVLIGFGLRLYGVGNFEFKGDEYQVMGTAVGYYHSGVFYIWDFLNDALSNSPYDRAWPHTWLIAQSYKVFGISEWSSRIVSVVFGTFLIFIAYIIGKRYSDSKDVALMFAFAITFSPYFIDLSRYVRMYILFIPIYLLSIYLIYNGLTGSNNYNITRVKKIFNEYFDFNYIYLFFGLIMLYISYLLHLNTLIYGAPLIVFLGYMACSNRDKKYTYSFAVILFSISLLAIMAYYPIFQPYFAKITSFIAVRDPPNIAYWDNLFSERPLPKSLSIVLIFSSIPIMIKNNKFMYLLITTFVTAIILIYLGNRYHSTAYISNIIPIAMLLIVISIFNLCKLYNNNNNNNKTSKLLVMLLIIFYVANVSVQFYDSADSIYGTDNSNSLYRPAYKTIIENSEANQVIMGQYLKAYYIKDAFKNKNIAFVSMENNGKFSYEEYQNTIHTYDSGWITWKTEKAYHIRKDIREDIAINFIKYHGHDVDNTHVEVYYFNKSMVEQSSNEIEMS